MFDLLLGFFILGSIALAFREAREKDTFRRAPIDENDKFDQSVYDSVSLNDE